MEPAIEAATDDSDVAFQVAILSNNTSFKQAPSQSPLSNKTVSYCTRWWWRLPSKLQPATRTLPFRSFKLDPIMSPVETLQ